MGLVQVVVQVHWCSLFADLTLWGSDRVRESGQH